MLKRNLIVIVAVVVIVISLINLGVEITGNSLNEGVLNITVSQSVEINFTVDNINFGEGAVNLGYDNATVDTLGNVVGGNWTPVSQGFELENIGNVNVSLKVSSGKNASEFLGGSNSSYQYNVTNLEEGSCSGGGVVLGQWYDVNTTEPGTLICGPFLFKEGKDSIVIDLKLNVPADSKRGSLSDTMTVTGTVYE